MENLDIVAILKVGLSGLVFLLSLLAFRLLTKEQEKIPPSDRMLKSIRHFMHLNIFLAVLTIAAPIAHAHFVRLPPDDRKEDVFKVMAKVSKEIVKKGEAAVCFNTSYADRHLLITDTKADKMIQVWARAKIPCTGDIHISLTPEDATKLGWAREKDSFTVAVAPAKGGQMFVPMSVSSSE